MNFRSSGLSSGLDDRFTPFELPGLILDILEHVDFKVLKTLLPATNCGNGPAIESDFGFLSGHNLFFYVWSEKVAPIMDREIKSILEIGGGFGEFARTLLTRFNNLESYTIVELPISAAQAAYYLHQTSDVSISVNGVTLRNSPKKASVKIITPDRLLSADQFDFVINTRSMMEMNHSAIKGYFDHISKYLPVGGYFLNINRYYKDTSGDTIRICDFPYDKAWQVLSSEKSFRQPRIHFLLTKRLEENKIGDIQEVLKAISLLPESNPKIHIENFKKGSNSRVVFDVVINQFKWIPYDIRKKIARKLLSL